MRIQANASSIQRSFLKFDIAALEGKTVLSAEFGIHLNEYFEFNTPSMQLTYSDDDSWTVDTISWDNQPSSHTAIGASEHIEDPGQYYIWDVFPYWNNDEHDNSLVSYIFTLGNESDIYHAVFASSEAAENQPYLKVTYIPEPATMLLLGLGAICLRKPMKK